MERQGIKSTPGTAADQVFVGCAINDANINGMVANVLYVEQLGTKAMSAIPAWAHAKSANRKSQVNMTGRMIPAPIAAKRKLQ